VADRRLEPAVVGDPVASQVNVAKGQRFEGLQTPANKAAFMTPLAALAAATQWLPVDANAPDDCAHKKDLQTQAFHEAAEGIRTLDLLHGKQSVQRRFRTNIPANEQFLATEGSRTLFGIHREITWVWVVNG
jgi:hypothetical protein